MRVLVVDNLDSFVYNLVHYLGELGAECVVCRADRLDAAEVAGLDPAGILLSPGPGAPEQATTCLDLIRTYAGRVPILGVCLGHQAIAVAYGAAVTRAPEPVHGKPAAVHHGGAGVLAGLPDPFTATRYHSLAVPESSVPAELEVTARTGDGVVMALRHRTLPVEGVQFHPEAVLTEGGHRLLANWLSACGHPGALDALAGLAPLTRRTA